MATACHFFKRYATVSNGPGSRCLRCKMIALPLFLQHPLAAGRQRARERDREMKWQIAGNRKPGTCQCSKLKQISVQTPRRRRRRRRTGSKGSLLLGETAEDASGTRPFL
eukprot:gene11453-biopygen22887